MPRRRLTAGNPINLFTNPTPHPNSRSLGWSGRNGGCLITRDAALVGEYGARAVSTSTGQSFGVFISDNYLIGAYGLSVGDVISARVEFRCPSAFGVQLSVRFQQGNTVLSNVTGNYFGGNNARKTATLENVTIPTGCDNFFLFTNSVSTAPNQSVDFDGAMLVPGATAPTLYVPGIALTAGTRRVTSLAAAARSTLPTTSPLSWSPPALTNPVTAVIGDDATSRNFTFSSDQDVILQWPDHPVTRLLDQPFTDSLIMMTGGRHIVSMGGRISIAPAPTCTLSSSVGADDTTLLVDSTTGFPSSGALRIDGESVTYAAKDSTAFYGCVRNYGYFNTGAFSTRYHLSGATIYGAEYMRSGITFKSQQGTRHIEGLVIDGQICDGIRCLADASAISRGILRLQNSSIGTIRAQDQIYETDGHSDCIQLIGAPAQLHLDRVSLRMRNGRGINNQGSTLNSPLLSASIRNTDMFIEGPTALGVANGDKATTAWSTINSWLVSPGGRLGTDDTALDPKFSIVRNSQMVGQFADPAKIGIGYANTVGYTA